MSVGFFSDHFCLWLMKKVLIISPIYPRFPDGSAAQTTLYHSLILLRRKYEVRMICILEEDIKYIIPPDNVKEVKVFTYSFHKRVSRNKYLDKIRTYRYYIHRYQNIGDEIFNIMENELKKQIYEYKADFILFEQLGFSMFNWRRRLVKNVNEKCLLRVHDALPLHLKKVIHYSKSVKESMLLRMQKYTITKLEKEYIKDWDGILTHSDVDGKYYYSLSSKTVPVNTAKIGIDIDYFLLRNSSQSKDIDMIYVGSMRWKPNVDCVVWFCEIILPLISMKLPSFRIFIVGRNPSKRVQRLASKNVIVTGEVEDIREYAKRSKLSFLFIFSGSGIKKKIMELLAMGIPIICDRESLQGYNEEEMGGVIIVNKTNITNIADTIVKLLNNEQLRIEMSQSAVVTARKYFDYRKIDYNFEEFVKM